MGISEEALVGVCGNYESNKINENWNFFPYVDENVRGVLTIHEWLGRRHST
jgi:hypothetical protein